MSDINKLDENITGLTKARIHYLDKNGNSSERVDVLTSSNCVVVDQYSDSGTGEMKRTFLSDIIRVENEDTGEQEFLNKAIERLTEKVKKLSPGYSTDQSITIKDKEDKERKANIIFQEI